MGTPIQLGPCDVRPYYVWVAGFRVDPASRHSIGDFKSFDRQRIGSAEGRRAVSVEYASDFVVTRREARRDPGGAMIRQPYVATPEPLVEMHDTNDDGRGSRPGYISASANNHSSQS